ncbi:hypothetical protein IFM89_011907 [Coptis chinensis]|uniref:Cytochrome P450 n=1 Tax=Coptis chinensis TaxID=261450 RepID=A0A835I1K7_9MAGN|nr:hypothetical protein IFM89_011907 [Coptis chinensis]
MKQWFGDLTLNVVVRMVTGKRFCGASAKLNDDEGRRFQKAIKDFFHLMGTFVVSNVLPCLGWLDFHGHEKIMRKTAKDLDNIMGRWLDEHRQNRLDGRTNLDQDFMNVILSTLEDNMIFGYDADIVNKAICLVCLRGCLIGPNLFLLAS